MAKISLREYIHKIENLIDRGETDQAIFHSKSILKYYPKHIDTYRLLGKAFLEKKKFGDAADIFQRVLSSVTDDFISHIGMSIIREDENNLDAAIWHMERAFETQPSNKAVQEELIKLYSMRDGVAPPKIRLTRGALVRMYVKGDLHTQAIAEIQAALSEDPNRVDLEVILAQLYNLMGQNVEAMEICSRLISKLPYCYEANIILTEILPGTGRSEDEKIFRQRVIELDPYFEFVDATYNSSNEVPDDKIMLEYLEYDGNQIDQSTPDWAESIGLDISNEFASGDEEKDDWFNFDENSEGELNDSTSVESEISNDSGDETIISVSTRTDLSELLKSDESENSPLPDFIDNKEDSVLPEWIKEAGWIESENEDIEIQKGFNIVEENNDEPINEINSDEEIDIEPGEIPDWLKKIAPVDQINELDESMGNDHGDESDQAFEKLFDQLAASKENRLSNENQDPALEWLKEFQSAESDDLSSLDEESDLEFLQETESEATTEESIFEVDRGPAVEKDEMVLEDTKIDQSEKPEITSESTAEVEFSEQNIGELEEMESTIEISKSTVEEPESSMAWLEALSEDSTPGQTEDSNITDDITDFPEWMKTIDKSPDETETLDDTIIQSVSSDKDSSDESPFELPDWLKLDGDEEFEQTESQIPEVNSAEQSLTKGEDLLGEFEGVSIETEDLTIDAVHPENESKESEELIPAELIEMEENVLSSEIDEEQDDINSALTWMESLATKHGATEETLLSKPEERDENPPDWIKALSSLEQTESDQLNYESEEYPDLKDEQENMTPDWLQALQIETTGGNASDFEAVKPSTDSNQLEESDEVDLSVFTPSENEEEVDEEIEELLRETGALANLMQDENERDAEKFESSRELAEEDVRAGQSDIEFQTEEISPIVSEVFEEFDLTNDNVKVPETGRDLTISKSSQERLDQAKQFIVKGKIEDALDIYNEFIHAELVLDQVIIDLLDALNNKYPIDINLWQALGDAQLRNNQLQEALNSYTKAEELLS